MLNLHGVYQALLKSREARGAVDFETTETQIVCDENGRIEKIVPRTRNEAHKLIEEAMLAANVCSADFIEHSGRVGLFRVHDKPSLEKQDILRNYLKAMGVGMALGENPVSASTISGRSTASRMRAVWSAMSVRPMKAWSGRPNHILVTPAPVT